MNQTNGISPRNEFVLSSGNGGGIIQGDYKLIFGKQAPAFWTTLGMPLFFLFESFYKSVKINLEKIIQMVHNLSLSQLIVDLFKMVAVYLIL